MKSIFKTFLIVVCSYLFLPAIYSYRATIQNNTSRNITAYVTTVGDPRLPSPILVAPQSSFLVETGGYVILKISARYEGDRNIIEELQFPAVFLGIPQARDRKVVVLPSNDARFVTLHEE